MAKHTKSWSQSIRIETARDAVLVAAIRRETDRAVLATVRIECGAGIIGRDVWFPKSQVSMTDTGLRAPAWLLSKKLAEIKAETGLVADAWFVEA